MKGNRLEIGFWTGALRDLTSIHPIRVEGRTERAIVKFILRDFEMKGLAAKRDILRGRAEGYKPLRRGRVSAARSANNIATWLTGCAKTRARLSWRARPSLRRDSNPTITLYVVAPMARALPSWAFPPNLFCGEQNAHGPLKWVAIQEMQLAVTACAHLAELWERKGRVKPSSR